MEPGVYAYFVEAGQHTPESVKSCLAQMELDNVWLRILELDFGADKRLLMLEMFDLESGAPLDIPNLGQLLAREDRVAYLAAVDPTDQGAAFEHFAAGEQRLAWSGPWDSFSHEEHGEGREGFLRAVVASTGLRWDELTAAAAAPPPFVDVADDQTELFIRGRLVGVPEGMPRYSMLFRLHYAGEEADFDLDKDEEEDALDEAEEAQAQDQDEQDEDEEDEDGDDEDGDELEPGGSEADDGQGRMLLLLLDPELSRFLWEEAPAAHVAAFLTAIEPVRGAVLGPLAHALPDVIQMVQAQQPDRPLARSPLRELLVYEVLSVATAVGFLAGDAVSYYDQLFFPLLNLSDGPIVAEAIHASLQEIREMDLLAAMVEVLPYSAPEGALLESFDDEELTPLAGWAEQDGVYEGSVFLLDDARLRGVVQRFDDERLAQRVEQFQRAWGDILPPGNEWHAGEADLDEADLARFRHRVQELRLLLALCEANRLQPALFFYD